MSYDVIVIKQRNLLQPSNQVMADLLNHSSFVISLQLTSSLESREELERKLLVI